MKRNFGSVLPITLILVTALLLLTNIMYLLNRQYQSEIDVIDATIVARQDLLSMGKDRLQGLTNINGDDFIEWGECDPFEVPQLLLDPSKNIYHQQAKLSSKCGFGYQAYRVWLANKDRGGALLVLDALLLDSQEWQEEIASKESSVSVGFKNTQWEIQIANQDQVREMLIFSKGDRDERRLKYQQMRKQKDNDEIILVFDNINQNRLELYRLLIGLNEWGLSAFDKLLVDVWQENGGQGIITPQWQAQVSKNWQLLLPARELEEVFVYNQVVFLAFKRQGEVGVIAITLEGQPFFGEKKLGVQRPIKEGVLEDYVLIKCSKDDPLLVGGRWQMGCFNQKVVRYFYR